MSAHPQHRWEGRVAQAGCALASRRCWGCADSQWMDAQTRGRSLSFRAACTSASSLSSPSLGCAPIADWQVDGERF
eukprot:1634525-Prymnesium_polylepis.1